MKKLICLSTLFLFAQTLVAQNHLSGKITTLESGEPLALASIYYTNNPSFGTITNSDGEFTLKKIAGSDSIKVSYMGYESVVYRVDNVPATIRLKVSPIQLEEVSVYPVQKLVEEIWKKYYQIYKAELKKSKKVREAEKNIFFYRQITQTDTIYNEFMECFFTGTNLYGVEDLQLKKGRYAKYEEDGLNLMTLTNFFYVSTIQPFYPENPTRKNAINVFIQPNSAELFDIMVVRTIDGGKDGKILVFEFTPKENNPKKIMSGNLYVRSKDLAILRMECSLDIGLTGKDNEWNDIRTLSH